MKTNLLQFYNLRVYKHLTLVQILNTLMCNNEIEITNRRKLKFGAKLVRGAYIIEETKLAEKERYQNPVVDGFDKTTDNYLSSLELILENYKKQEGEVIVATHNQDTIKSAKALRIKYSGCLKMSFGQLLGLADHLTQQLKQKGETVYKLLPWAKTDVMIAYMIRRAQELQQMRYPLDIQRDLLLHELKSRYL